VRTWLERHQCVVLRKPFNLREVTDWLAAVFGWARSARGRSRGVTGASHAEPLHTLREYRNLAPWNLHDLAALVGAVLDCVGDHTDQRGRAAQPSERMIAASVVPHLPQLDPQELEEMAYETSRVTAPFGRAQRPWWT